MTERAPDDIFALFSRFDLDGDDYHVFVRSEISTVKPMTVMTAHEPLHLTTSVEEQNPLLQSAFAGFAPEMPEEAGAPVEAAPVAPIPFPSDAAQTNRLGLRNLWRHVAGRAAHPSIASDSLARVSVSIYGTAGGAGVTTITAVLARLLAKAGRRCAIIDGSEASTLPVFFGAQRLSDDHRHFSGIYSLFEPKIRILNSQVFGAASIAANDLNDWILAETGGDFDHLIFDKPAHSSEQFGSALNLCVAVPDVSSLIGARKLKAALDTAAPSSETICILNRFDPRSALHQEILGWYTENFREVVTILDSSLVSEALAEGTTVLDWIPQADVSADFTRLFKAAWRLLNSQPERLPLCS